MTTWTQEVRDDLAALEAKNAVVIKASGADVGVDANIYASGDLLGLKLTLANVFRVAGGSGILQSIVIQDLTKQMGALDVVIFDSDPTGTTFTNNAALDIADADLPKIIGFFQVTAADYVSFADNAVAILKNLGLPVDVAAGTSLYACLVSRDTKTYVANELSAAFGFLQD